MTIFDFTVDAADGSKISLDRYRGRVLLIVNVASKCGFTGQYAGLQELYEKYHGRGFEVLGFPCNQFLWQEPGDGVECRLKYNVTFPVFGKVKVNNYGLGGVAPLYHFLKKRSRGVLWTTSIKWNFTKFLVSREGIPVKRFSTMTAPAAMEPRILQELEKTLAEVVTIRTVSGPSSAPAPCAVRREARTRRQGQSWPSSSQ